MKIEFETLESNISATIQRAKVPGGWLVLAVDDVLSQMAQGNITGFEWRSNITFVPDPTYSWKDTPDINTPKCNGKELSIIGQRYEVIANSMPIAIPFHLGDIVIADEVSDVPYVYLEKDMTSLCKPRRYAMQLKELRKI